MTASDFMESLAARGARLLVDGDALVVKSPPGVVTGEDLAALKRFKRDILNLLAALAVPDPTWQAVTAAAAPTPEPARRPRRPAARHNTPMFEPA